MPAEPTSKIHMLALAVASGSSVKAWCAKNGVSPRTAYRWAATEKFKARVRRLQSAHVDRTLAKLVRVSTKAVDCLEAILDDGSEARHSDQIAASRTVLGELVAIQSHIQLADRLAELEGLLAPAQQPSKKRGDSE